MHLRLWHDWKLYLPNITRGWRAPGSSGKIHFMGYDHIGRAYKNWKILILGKIWVKWWVMGNTPGYWCYILILMGSDCNRCQIIDSDSLIPDMVRVYTQHAKCSILWVYYSIPSFCDRTLRERHRETASCGELTAIQPLLIWSYPEYPEHVAMRIIRTAAAQWLMPRVGQWQLLPRPSRHSFARKETACEDYKNNWWSMYEETDPLVAFAHMSADNQARFSSLLATSVA